MSKHSHWAKIKHDKGGADKKRGALFSKLIKAIQIAAREGADVSANFKLRLVLDQAKTAGVTKDTIERAVARGSGQDKDAAQLFEDTYEGFAPGGIAIIIETISDSKNRTFQELKHLFSIHGGTLGSSNSVAWMFNRKGIIRLPNFTTLMESKKLSRDDLEMKLIEAGAEDLMEEDGGLSVFVKPEDLKSAEEKIRSLELEPEYVGLDWIAKEKVAAKDENAEKLEAFQNALDEREDVSNYFTNETD